MQMQQEELSARPRKETKINSFMHALPKAIQIFEVLQHVKKSIYPFEMRSHTQKPMSVDQEPYSNSNTPVNEGKWTEGQNLVKFKPQFETVQAHFERQYLIYDKFNNNNDEELFNQNIYPIQKLKNLKNIDYMISVEHTKCFQKKQQSANQLAFNSRFQSGNLSLVSYINDTYYLLLHNDVNTTGYTSWFYFQVRNKVRGRYKFAILNYGKAGLMHNYGVRICVHDSANGWVRGCDNIVCECNRAIFRKGNYSRFNTLYFEYEFKEDASEVYFAYNVPYTYNDLCCTLDKIEQQKHPFFTRKLAGISLAGNRLEMVTITNFALLSEGVDLPVILLMARAHPGETVSSWIMHELIMFLISDKEQAILLRNNFIFKLFPMINPDGVIHGNYRCSLSGRDLNRRWNEPNKQLFPEVYHIRNQIVQLSKRKTIKMILDLHGHTKKKKVFAYGCNNRSQPHRCRLFPYIVSKQTSYFQFKFCNYHISKSKYGTARISLFNELKIPYIYTIQTSQFGTFEGHLSLKIFKEISLSLGRSFSILFRAKQLKSKTEEDTSTQNTDKYESFQKQLINDSNLLKSGTDRDSGSESEPSVDNIKYDKLVQMNKRKDMKIDTKLMDLQDRLKSLNDTSQNLQKPINEINRRPKTTQQKSRRYFQGIKQQKPLILDKMQSSPNKIRIDRLKRDTKPTSSEPNKSVSASTKRTEVLNYINLSVSVFDDTRSTRSYQPARTIQDIQQLNDTLFSKLKLAPRSYMQFRRLK